MTRSHAALSRGPSLLFERIASRWFEKAKIVDLKTFLENECKLGGFGGRERETARSELLTQAAKKIKQLAKEDPSVIEAVLEELLRDRGIFAQLGGLPDSMFDLLAKSLVASLKPRKGSISHLSELEALFLSGAAAKSAEKSMKLFMRELEAGRMLKDRLALPIASSRFTSVAHFKETAFLPLSKNGRIISACRETLKRAPGYELPDLRFHHAMVFVLLLEGSPDSSTCAVSVLRKARKADRDGYRTLARLAGKRRIPAEFAAL